jgi:hypothetical protein
VGKASRYHDAKAKRPPGAFVPLPRAVLLSARFAALSSHAVKLLMDLLSQYNGANNGDLNMAWSSMVTRDWRSRDTLAKARDELLRSGWIAQTRQGGRHAPSLYGVTIFAMDPCAKLDISARDFPRGAWDRPIDGAKARNGDTPGGPSNRETDTPIVSQELISAAIDTPSVSVKGSTAQFVTRPAGSFLDSPSTRRQPKLVTASLPPLREATS